jgi:hypothetical protein
VQTSILVFEVFGADSDFGAESSFGADFDFGVLVQTPISDLARCRL